MVAGETGKIGIIVRSRDAKAAAAARYSDVRDAIKGYLCNPARTSRTLAEIGLTFEQKAADTSLGNWAREDARLSVDVLKALARMENKLAGMRFVPAPDRQAKLILAGVAVSVQLNVLTERDRAGKLEVGGVLFRLTKADDETESAAAKRHEMGAYAATLAYMQVQAGIAGNRQPHHQLCASLDIQAGDVHTAPRTYATKAKALEDACRFIAAMWDTA